MQQRQFSRSESELTFQHAQRAARLTAALRGLAAIVGAAALSVLSVGCPGAADLENPGQFCKPGASLVDASGQVTGCKPDGATGGSTSGGGGSSAAGTTSGGAPGSPCETACMTALFRKCTVCHGSALQSSGLDLEKPGYTARLKDQPAQHGQISGTPTCPSGDKLVDSMNPTASWLLKKVSAQEGECGDPMPAPSGSSADEIACVTTYVNCVGGK